MNVKGVGVVLVESGGASELLMDEMLEVCLVQIWGRRLSYKWNFR